jgi:hypothetical protein
MGLKSERLHWRRRRHHHHVSAAPTKPSSRALPPTGAEIRPPPWHEGHRIGQIGGADGRRLGTLIASWSLSQFCLDEIRRKLY